EDIGKVVIGHRVKRGDSSVNGYDAVVMTVQKQPDVDTRRLTEEIKIALDSIKKTLPPDVRLEITYQQREFIDYSVKNVVDAIRDGFLFVVVILVVFLLNVRTTVITLTAIPLSLLTTFLVFRWFGLTINVMTLGGIAVALGELVDDAIVDVENIYKRLKQNRNVGKPQSRLQVIFEASSEVRLAIMNSTIIVVMVFVPLFALAGVEGRLFASLGVAYIVSILASTLVSLTVTPVLAYYLLGNYSKVRKHQDPFVLCWLKKLVTPLIQLSLSRSGFILILFVTVFLVLLSVVRVARMGKDFLPPFDEGSAQANLFLPAGASLEASAQVSEIATGKLQKLMKSKDNPDGLIVWLTCRSGRAEEDEHVMGVNGTEITMSLNPDHKISQDDRKKLLQDALDGIPGAELELEQPVAHLINHMISGVAAEIGIKIYGDDLLQLRMKAEKVRDLLRTLDGLANPVIEQQQMVPQLKLEIDPIGLAKYGLTTEQVYRMVETAMQGRVVGRILDGEKQFDLLVRYQEDHRTDLDNLDRMPVETPVGMRLPLSEVASITVATGPNTIKRENARRRIIVRVNTIDRDLVSAVEDIQAKLAAEFKLPADYYY
ncbi:MAG: efflux RND transporter permease subunit, partial [Planctomycetota bacterium]|nr:efflux RND transporter permease subunit [Planctomycetota bacterium]